MHCSGARKREGVGRTTAAFAVVIIIIILAVGIFLILSAGGLANIGIGGNGSANNTPIGITLTTTNSTLAPAIVTAGGAMPVSYLQSHALILQPNVLYAFNVTVTAVNSNLKPINTSLPIPPLEVGVLSYTNGTFNTFISGMNVTLTPSSGTLPFNAVLTIEILSNSNGSVVISANNITGVNSIFAASEIFVKSAY